MGALFYPTVVCLPGIPAPEGGAVSPIDLAPQIAFRSRDAFIDAWDAKWANSTSAPGVGTPLQETLERVDQALDSSGATSVRIVIVTDGIASNCYTESVWPASGTSLIADWTASGHSVHVIALLSATDTTEIDAIAAAGGHAIITPSDADALADALDTIATCDD